jgi:hypothetical protein
VKVSNNVTDKDKLRRYVEGLKDKVRTIIRVGMVDGRYAIFAKVKARTKRSNLSCGGRVGRLIPLDLPLPGRPKSRPPGLLVVALPTIIRPGAIRSR